MRMPLTLCKKGQLSLTLPVQSWSVSYTHLDVYKRQLFLLFSFLIILGILISMLYVVRQQSVAIVERFGRYQKIATSGIHMRLPFGIDKIAARIQLRLLQSEIVVETKTKDNVFVMMNVATQYRVNEQNVTDAYYKLMRPEAQIKSYIEDAPVSYTHLDVYKRQR